MAQNFLKIGKIKSKIVRFLRNSKIQNVRFHRDRNHPQYFILILDKSMREVLKNLYKLLKILFLKFFRQNDFSICMRLRDKNLDTRQRSNSTIRLWDKIRFVLTT